MLYVTVARWCNQISFFKKKSLREFADLCQQGTKSKCSSVKALELVEKDFPDIAEKYFDMKFLHYDGYGNKIE